MKLTQFFSGCFIEFDAVELRRRNSIANKIKFQCLHFYKKTEEISPELKSFAKHDT